MVLQGGGRVEAVQRQVKHNDSRWGRIGFKKRALRGWEALAGFQRFRTSQAGGNQTAGNCQVLKNDGFAAFLYNPLYIPATPPVCQLSTGNVPGVLVSE
jgi:hypothetical protein